MEDYTQATTTDEPTDDLRVVDEEAIAYMTRTATTLDDVEALGTFTGRVKALAGELDERGDVDVSAGRGAPDGVIGDYPDFWIALTFEQGAIYRTADALNDPLVDVHMIEHFDHDVVGDEGTFRRSYVEITLTPAIATEATDADVEQALEGIDA